MDHAEVFREASYRIDLSMKIQKDGALFPVDTILKHLGLNRSALEDLDNGDLVIAYDGEPHVTFCGALRLVGNDDSHVEIGHQLRNLIVSMNKDATYIGFYLAASEPGRPRGETL